MTLAASFKEYYSLPTTGAGGDKNVDSFNNQQSHGLKKTNPRKAVKAFNNANRTIFYAGQDRKLKIVHGLANLGNTMIRPESKIGGHMGLNAIVFVGIVDYVKALTIIPFGTPTWDKLADCITLEALWGLQPGVKPGY